ncbi:GvpL/GvpF family gas vesicle protein [Streptomyces sp. NPDC059688]|uniref:GvpL/GvpF family gas vesicle protein n=1 Tax=Streptomyces sp. NPDC059688 TaxID=3346906 RepID=UPI0036C8D706
MGRGELAAIVSDAPGELRPKRRDLLAHQRVLDEAATEGVVLPMRFGSVSADDDTVTTVLTEQAEHFLERLQALDGSAEYNIKANHDEEAVLRLIMVDREDIRSMADANREAGGGTQEQKMQLGGKESGGQVAGLGDDRAVPVQGHRGLQNLFAGRGAVLAHGHCFHRRRLH